MARNGSGTYAAPANSFNPSVALTTISKTDWNAVLDDLETALTESIARDGQTTTSAQIPFASGIAANTVAELSANTGVTVDGVLLKDGSFVANESGADVDTRIEGDTDANLVFVDASTDRVGIGTATPASKLDVVGTITSTSADAGATEGPLLDLYRNSATPADNDLIGHINFTGEDESGNKDTYAKILAQILDATGATEDALVAIQTVVAGTLATRLTVGQGAQIGAPTGGDPGAGKINATALQMGGEEIDGVATQAEMEAATDAAKVVAAGRAHFHPGVAKAWVSLNGTGTAAINVDYGVASITDNGTGDYTVTFDTAFSSAFYCAVGMFDITIGAVLNTVFGGIHTKATGSCRVVCSDASQVAQDLAEVNLAFFGDH